MKNPGSVINPIHNLILSDLFLFLDKAPRSRSKKLRRYDQVDITKEFEVKTKRREIEKL